MSSPQFTPDQSTLLLRHARLEVESAVRNRHPNTPLPADLSATPVTGVFVTLKLRGDLRACIGHWRDTDDTPLGPALTNSAHSAATRDHRFTPIGESELPHLTIELSILFNSQLVEADGSDRIAAVEVGRHGLLLEDSRHRGLLLPQVATERGWDARTFLQHTAIKAGLPKNAWKKRSTELTTFEAVKSIDDPSIHP